MNDNEQNTLARNAGSPMWSGSPGAPALRAHEASLREAFETYGAFLVSSLHRIDGETTLKVEPGGPLLAPTRPGSTLHLLSSREREVLSLMALGLGNAAIAERLFITQGAIHKHIGNIFAKLNLAPDDQVDRRVAAVLRYLSGT